MLSTTLESHATTANGRAEVQDQLDDGHLAVEVIEGDSSSASVSVPASAGGHEAQALEVEQRADGIHRHGCYQQRNDDPRAQPRRAVAG